MLTESGIKRRVTTVPLQSAVLCMDCETISNSPHDECPACGSRSLWNLSRIMGGTLTQPDFRSTESPCVTTRYNLELTLRLPGATAKEVNQVTRDVTESLNHLVTPDAARLHLHVESIAEPEIKELPSAA